MTTLKSALQWPLLALAVSAGTALAAAPSPQQMVDALHTTFGEHHARAVHAKGTIVEGSFTPAPGARALTDAPLEPAAGFLASTGTTGGATFVVPWTHAITTSVGADGDANAKELVAIRGGLDLKDRGGCVTLHANGAHRIGREGVDVWITLDFAPTR